MTILWLKFAVCAGAILFFGIKLSGAADGLVKSGRFTENFMGVFFLATITSFPEVFTAIASVVQVDAPDLGTGNLIGSVILNLMIIVILDYKYGARAALSQCGKDHLAMCGFSLAMLGVLLASMSLGVLSESRPGLFGVGIEGFLIFIIYALGITYIYRHTVTEGTSGSKKRGRPSRGSVLFVVYALAIIASGFWLASLGKEIVDLKGWDEMYFGTIILAFATSLPEIVVSAAAVSIGSLNMAVANILGSNLFNIAIVPLLDILYKKGYVLDNISSTHIFSCLFAIILTLIVFGSILYRPKKVFFRLGAGTVALIVFFILGNFMLYNIVHK